MSSIFKKLISDELGESNYNKYFFVCQKSLHGKTFDSKEIYFDIYDKLRAKDKTSLYNMQTRLNESLSYAMRINKTYYLSFILTISAILFLFAKSFHPGIIVVCMLVMIGSFLVKTYEYLINKYCFIDAQIVLVYKTVLDKIMLLKEIETQTKSAKKIKEQ